MGFPAALRGCDEVREPGSDAGGRAHAPAAHQLQELHGLAAGLLAGTTSKQQDSTIEKTVFIISSAQSSFWSGE